MYPREMETGSKERDGGGEGKLLAYNASVVLCMVRDFAS